MLHHGKKRVGLTLLSGKHAIELHPFGTPQSRCFHIVGTFYYGYAKLLHTPITAVFKRRHEESLRPQSHNALNGRRHSAAAIGHNTLLKFLLHIRHMHITGVADATEALLCTQPHHELA